jgi:tetratricopeptide (TPR) repeat protein
MAKGSKRKVSDNQKKADKTPTGSVKSAAFFRKPVVHILIIVVLGILIYSNTFNVPFAFDDTTNIYDSVIKDVHHIIDPLNIYSNRLIGQLTFALNYKMHGLNVAGYHVFNLFVHLLNALLVYWLIMLTFRTPYAAACLQKDVLKTSDSYRWIPLFSALLFVSHPVQTQAVTYIVQRFASLSTLFYLISLVTYIKARGSESSKKARYAFFAASIISAVLAMRTKEIAFTLPVMVFLYEFMFFRGDIRKRMLYLLPLLPLLLTMLIIPLSMMLTQSGSTGARVIDELTKMAGSADVSRWDYLNTQFPVIVTYIRLLFFPIHQNLDYDYPIYRTFFTPPVFLSLLVLLGVFCWGIYLLYRSYKSDQANCCSCRLIAFGIFWFFVTLSVESSIIPIVDVIFEHRLYLPSVGFSMAFISGMVFIYVRLANRTKVAAKVFMPVMILVVISLSLTAYARNMVWSEEVTLWEDVVKKSPHKARPHYNLGAAYQEQGRLDDAVKEYKMAINLEPDFVKAHHNMGLAYERQGRLDDSIKEYQTAIKLKPDYPIIHSNLGVAYQKQGRLDDAIKEFQTAINLAPDYADAHNNLGAAYQEQGRLDDAIKEFQTAINLAPDNANAHFNLGLVYQKQGRLDDSIKEYQTAINLKPDHTNAHYSMGLAYQAQGRLDDAIREFQTAINLTPDYADAHNNLGVVYHKQGRLHDAVKEYQTAIKLKPDDPKVYNNLGLAYSIQGRLHDAIKEYQTAIKLSPDYVDAHNNLGRAYRIQGRLDNASRNIRQR